MNNRKFLLKVKRSLHNTIFGDRVTIIVRTPWIQENYGTYWEKMSDSWEDKHYFFYGYKTKPQHAKFLLKELQGKFKSGAKYLTK